MNNFSNAVLNLICEYAENKKFYSERIAGDSSSFRYPHLAHLKDEFAYDEKNDVYIIKDGNRSKLLKSINRMSTNEITVYELMNKKAKRLHLYDFLGYKATSNEKICAFISVTKDYLINGIRGKWRKGCRVFISNIDKCDIVGEFEGITNFINRFKSINMVVALLDQNNTIFQFGSTLKGTNIIFVDKNLANLKQEIFHLNYHIEEGIRGFNDDNLNIVEKWANVPWLYLLQLLNGRLDRRIRKKASPHDIKFLDYVFMRAYLGQAFEPNFIKEDISRNIYHSVFAIIEPSVKLIIHSLNVGEREQINNILINAICYDKCDVIKEQINKLLGNNSYEGIYYDYNLFNRIKTIDLLCERNNINKVDVYKKMFNNEKLLSTLINYKLVAFIWFSDKINSNKDLVIDLIENYSLNSYNKHGLDAEITIEDWMVHIKKKFGNQLYNVVKKEYQKNKNIIEVL